MGRVKYIRLRLSFIFRVIKESETHLGFWGEEICWFFCLIYSKQLKIHNRKLQGQKYKQKLVFHKWEHIRTAGTVGKEPVMMGKLAFATGSG